MPRRKRPFSKYDIPDLPEDFNQIAKRIKLLNHCPICNTKFVSSQSKLVEDDEDKHLVYMNCEKCLNSVLAVINFGMMGITSIGMITDLTYDDVVRFRNNTCVSADDVIAAHQIFSREDWAKSLINN